ncbi:hypothetical protein CR513_00744, partial [Mucuna pruriens]
MEKQNPSENSSTNKCPSSPSDDSHTLNPANNNMQGESLMKTPWQVLEELACSDDGGNEGDVGGEAPAAVAVGAGAGSSMVVDGRVASEGMLEMKKRKVSDVRDPPSGKPTCPVCHKEFPTWKGAFGHMRAHPDREYRGFFKPPVFDSPSSTQDHPLSDNKGDSAKKSIPEVNSGEKGSASLPVQVLMFDLNEPVDEAGSSHAAEPAEEKSAEERKGLGFDLNETPPPEDYDMMNLSTSYPLFPLYPYVLTVVYRKNKKKRGSFNMQVYHVDTIYPQNKTKA